MASIEELERRISEVEERNTKVELDKQWETSWVRRILLLVFTYLAIFLYFLVIGLERPYIHAVVPTLGFLLSTLSLPFFKKIWMERRH